MSRHISMRSSEFVPLIPWYLYALTFRGLGARNMHMPSRYIGDGNFNNDVKAQMAISTAKNRELWEAAKKAGLKEVQGILDHCKFFKCLQELDIMISNQDQEHWDKKKEKFRQK